MQTKKDEPVLPIRDETDMDAMGLTKREYFAAMALQGIVANPVCYLWNSAAELAVKKADELIFELNKQPGRQPYEKPNSEEQPT